LIELQTSTNHTIDRLGVGTRSMLECIPQGILVVDREERILFFSDVARGILGAGSSEVPLEAWTAAYGLFLPDRVTRYPHHQLPWVRALRGDTVIDAEICVRSPAVPKGALLTVNGAPWKDEAGLLQGGIAILRDVTADRRSRDALQRLSNAVERTAREAIEDRDSEMRLAGLVQSRLHPPLLQRAGIDIAGCALPANATGGDYYDYLRMREGRLGIVVADVSGHGLGAALIMVATRAALRSCADIPISLDDILDHVNATLLSDLEPGRFVTMCLASLDTEALTLTYSNAGHPSGYVLSGAGEIKCVMESTRIPLGVMSDWKSQPTRSIPLERGDILVFLTDGILESIGGDGRPFGVENVLALVKEHRLEPAQRILEHVLNAVQTAGEGVPQEDDMTAVICKLDPGP
jgi:serine phosphatase RsbU (regulator of sigma subunit)